MAATNDEQLYLEATQEVDSGTQAPALWAKAMALAEGDEKKAKYRYIKLRVEELSNASAAAPPAPHPPQLGNWDEGASVAPEDNTPSAEPSTSPSPKTAGEPILEDGNLHAGDAGPLESESDLVSRYAITFDGAQYHYQQYRYNRLSDAINYAELDRKKSVGAPPRSTSPLPQSDPISTKLLFSFLGLFTGPVVVFITIPIFDWTVYGGLFTSAIISFGVIASIWKKGQNGSS